MKKKLLVLFFVLGLVTIAHAKYESDSLDAASVVGYGNYGGVIVPLKVTADGTVVTSGGAGGTPGGSDTQVQFNDGGSAFGGDAGMTFNKTTNVLTVGSLVTDASDGSNKILMSNNTSISPTASSDEIYFEGNVLKVNENGIEKRVLNHHLRFNIIDPAVAYAKDHEICIVPKFDAGITVTNLEVTCNADPATEPTGDIKWADSFIGLANATVINTFDTTAGATSDSTILSGSVASGKAVYVSFDTTPDTLITQMSFDISYY